MNIAPSFTRFNPFALSLFLFAVVNSGGCNSMPEPSARVVGVRLTDLTLESATLDFDVAIENHYPVALPLVDLDYSLAREGKPFLTGHAPVQGTVPANGSTTVVLPATLNFARVFASFQDVKPGSVIPYDASLKLSVNAPLVGKKSLPLKKSGQLPIPAIPNIEVTDIQWKGLDFNRTEGTVHLHVTNNNQFALDVTHIALGLQLGGHSIASTGIDQPTSLPANSDATLAIPIAFSPKDLGLAAFQLIQGSGSDYHVTGLIAANTPYGPLSFPYDKAGSTAYKK